MLDTIDSTLGYEEIKQMRCEAVTFCALAESHPLKNWLEQFIVECDAHLPSHKCWLEDDQHIVIESPNDGWKHILVNIMFELEEGGLEQICYACVKRYELKHQLEPYAYNQAEPGLYARYPYLYRIRISHETWLELTKLWCERFTKEKEKEKEKEEETSG